MSPQQIAAFVVVALLLWLIHEMQMKKFRCQYCGCYKGHDMHCPYKILD